MYKNVINIGLLGASEIAQIAIIEPARLFENVLIKAVAARDLERAKIFAKIHGISTIASDYEALIARDDIDLIYISLPNSLHETWAIKALNAGKHVLLEKPAAVDASSAKRMLDKAMVMDKRLIEAFHYRYHPLFLKVLELTHGDVLGEITGITISIDVPLGIELGHNRWDRDLGGGALKELGCYGVHQIRHLLGEVCVTNAVMNIAQYGVDDHFEAHFESSMGVNAYLDVNMAPHDKGRLSTLRISTENGNIDIRNAIAPQLGHEFSWSVMVEGSCEVHTEDFGVETSYVHQLKAVVQALIAQTHLPSEGQDIVQNALLIDAIYTKALGAH